MLNRILWSILFFTVLWLGVSAVAGQPEDPYEGRERVEIDQEILRTQGNRAAMQDYKRRRLEEAQRAGKVPSGEGGYVPLPSPRATGKSARPKSMGGITYDDGMVTGTAGIASQMVGNRFNSALNPAGTMCCFPVETSGSITMITFDMVNTFFNSAVFSIYSNIMGTMAVQVTSMARPGIMTGLNTLSIMSPTTMNAYMNGTFVAGIWQFDPTMTAVGVGTGSAGGQGFHAVSLNDGAAGTMLTTVTTGGGMGMNAVFRVSGWVATPVELMSFEVVDD